MRVAIYCGERYLGDKSSYAGPQPDYVPNYSFAPIESGDVPAAGLPGLIEDQVTGSGDKATFTISAPNGSRVAELASGGLALFLPGEGSGIDAADALVMARRGQCGLSIVN
jgi:hypothetical protein